MAEKKSPNPNPVNSIFVRGGTTKNLDMLVVKYDKAEHNYQDKEGNDKTVHFMDAQAAQVEGANPDLKRQINPHLFSQKNHEGPHAGKYNTQVGYYDSQMDAIKEAAGDNVFAVNDKDGNQVGSVYAVKSNVIFRKHEVDGKEVSNGAAMDTKTLQPVSDEFAKQLHEMEANGGVMQHQFDAVGENIKDFQAAQAAKADKQAEAPQVEQAETKAPEAEQQAEADEPEFG